VIGLGLRAERISSKLSLEPNWLWHCEEGVWVFLREYPPEPTVGI